MTAVVEDQDVGRAPTSRAVLVCHHTTDRRNPTAEWTYWPTIQDARQAEAELASPCGPHCNGVHTVVRVDREPNRRRRATTRTRT